MKIRIQDNSLRLRMTLKEVEALAETGRVARSMQVQSAAGPGGRLDYELVRDATLAESDVVVTGSAVSVRLCDADFRELQREDREGVYLRRQWTGDDGTQQRFMAFVEKDRPGSTCEKIEQWIYDAPARGEVELRPIPPNVRRG
ncbi:hypothetical protein CVU37_12865 [candidate division BRC1 bacterium HGW-BRC1-1]|jgi:hypothetical protein|nr:MAG: hypothetical protein CVU37_12865 [candidate division BRC1 bacterium HGW-BRC1-1]